MGEQISVTKTYIEGSDRGDVNSCMVASAVRDQLDLPLSDYNVVVDGERVKIHRRGSSKTITRVLPKDVQFKVQDWDEGEDPTPFNFELDLPADWRTRLKAK